MMSARHEQQERRPRVSIGLPVFNGENYLRCALESLVTQTYEDMEIIISDNHSTDSTIEICEEYAARDPRIRLYLHETNRGASWNFNFPIEVARGEYFKWHAHDDMLAPTCVERSVEALDANPDAVIAYPLTIVVDEDNRAKRYYKFEKNLASPKPHHRYYDLLMKFNWAYEVFGVMRMDALKHTDYLGNYSASDEVLLGQMAMKGPFVEIPEFLFISREHEKQSIQMRSDREAYMVWFDPNHAGDTLLPHWKTCYEHWHSVTRAPINFGERMCCYSVAAAFGVKNAYFLLKDLVKAGVNSAARLPARLRASRRAPEPQAVLEEG